MSTATISVILGILGSGRPVLAQSSDAAALFNEGKELMADGILARACDAFEASNRIEPTAGTLIYLGECRKQNDQLASALSAYNDALARVKDPRKRKRAMAQVAALESQISYLTISVPDESRVDGLALTYEGRTLDPTLWNRAIPVDGGDYIVTARAPDHDEWQTAAHVAVERDNAAVEVPRLAPSRKSRSSPTFSAAPLKHDAVSERREAEVVHPPETFTMTRKISIGVAGASVISLVAAAALGRAAQVRQNEALMLCSDHVNPCTRAVEANALIHSGNRLAFEANVAFGAAAAALIGAGVLWFTGAPDEEMNTHVSVAPNLELAEIGLVVTRRF